MARVVRNQRQAYDNIAVASAISTVERTIDGSAPPTEAYGAGSNIAIAEAFAVAGTPHENIQVGVDYGTGENVAVGG